MTRNDLHAERPLPAQPTDMSRALAREQFLQEVQYALYHGLPHVTILTAREWMVSRKEHDKELPQVHTYHCGNPHDHPSAPLGARSRG